jgi:hypothetical protein
VLAGCQRSRATPQIVATVYHRPIQRAALDQYVRYAESFDALAYPDSAEARCLRAPTAAACSRLTRQVLGRLIEERIVMSYAANHRIKLTSSDWHTVNAQLSKLSGATSPTAGLFRRGTVKRAFMRSVLAREVLVQKVEAAVAGQRALRGTEVHLRKLLVPSAAGTSRQNLYQQTVSIAGGGPVPQGTTELFEWIAPFRLPANLRGALNGAHKGDYVGPFQHSGGFLLVQYLGRAVHAYGRPARDALTAKYFSAWMRRALPKAHPRCLDPANKLGPCPGGIIKTV